MTPGTGPAFEQAMSDLLLKVNRDNVLAAQAEFQRHADQLFKALNDMDLYGSFGKCGGDPISAESLGPNSFGGKIAALKQVHWDHQTELLAVVARLGETARRYGFTEAEIESNLKSVNER